MLEINEHSVWYVDSHFELLIHDDDRQKPPAMRDDGNTEKTVFHTGTGNTYVLDQVAIQALRFLAKHAMTCAELSKHLADDLQYDQDVTFDDYVERMLWELNRQELINKKPAAPSSGPTST